MRRAVIALGVAAIVLAATLHAQVGNQASVEGVVVDSSGAVVRNAAVRVRDRAVGAEYSTSTSDDGWFGFLVLPVGRYELTVEQAGFAKLVDGSVLLGVGAHLNLRLVLQPAARPDFVEVHAESPVVETTRSAVTTSIDSRAVTSLPMNGRNIVNLTLLVPATTNGATGFTTTGQNQASSFMVDGADHNNFIDGPVGTGATNRYLFSQEAVQEFQVNISSYSAEFGRVGTGVINIITKSGTNAYHGVGFWYFRDRGLNATGLINKLTDQPKDPFHAHQFGGSFGGPILKDRLFFYGNFDGQRRAEQTLIFLNLPSGFQLSPNPVTAGFQQIALDYLRARGQSWPRTFNQNVGMVKLDWRASPANLVSTRWNRHRLHADNFANLGPQQALEHTGLIEQLVDTFTASVTSTITPALVNVARFSYVSSSQPFNSNSNNPEANVFEQGQQVLQIGRSARLPVDNAVDRGEWSDTVALSHGKHALRFGISMMSDWNRFYSGLNFFGSYRFNSLASFGRSLAGTPAPQPGERYIQAFSGEGTPPIMVNPNYIEPAAFLQDEWRIAHSLTLNLGVRYEVQVMRSPPLRNPAASLATAGVDTSFMPTDGNNFSPRLGFAWAPLQSNRLVIRGGYGIYYPRLLGATAARAFFQNGITSQTRTFAAGFPSAALIPAYPNNVCGAPDPSGAPPQCAAPPVSNDTLMAFSSTYRQPYVQQSSLGVEYELAPHMSISVSYLGAKGTHLGHWQDINLGEATVKSIGVANTSDVVTYKQYSSLRPIAGFDRIFLWNTNGNSVYHGLAVQVRKEFSNNLQFLAAYTFSRAIDDNPTQGGLNPGPGDGSFLSDSGDPRLDRGLADADERHRFVFSGTWDLKYGERLPRPARVFLSGWSFSSVFTAETGQHYSGLVSFDLNNDGDSATDRLLAVPRNSYSLPSSVALDTRLTRVQHLTERLQLQVSWDAFNLLNRANINGVRTTQYSRSTQAGVCGAAGTPCLVPQTSGDTALGTPNSTLDPRIMQFSAKLTF